MYLGYRNTCRICNNSVLKPTFSLGNHALHGSFINPSKDVYPPIRRIPVELVRCDPEVNNGCGLLQLKHTVSPSILYSDYGYRSSTNETMKGWLKYIVDSILKLKPDLKSVQDIGANDLFTLKQFSQNIRRVGVDGCDIIRNVDPENIEIINGLYPNVKGNNRFIKTEYDQKYFDVILSLACLYDIEKINEFVSQVSYELNGSGLWVFEVAYLPTILRKIDYSHFCHEHLLTFSLCTIEKLLERNGFKIFQCRITGTNGGSILCYACHVGNNCFDTPGELKELQKIRLQEFDMMLDTDAPYLEFRDKVNEHGRDLYNLITKIVERDGKTIHLYSASTKGNVLLQHAKIDNKLIKYAAERSPEKVGCKTLGTNIEIISEEESRQMKPDYYLCLIPAFKIEVLEREKEIIEKGTRFIFPFPYPISIVG